MIRTLKYSTGDLYKEVILDKRKIMNGYSALLFMFNHEMQTHISEFSIFIYIAAWNQSYFLSSKGY